MSFKAVKVGEALEYPALEMDRGCRPFVALPERECFTDIFIHNIYSEKRGKNMQQRGSYDEAVHTQPSSAC